MKVGVYVMTCDKNLDILKHSLISIDKYFNPHKLQLFIGTNTEQFFNDKKIINITATKSNWKEESLTHLIQIKKLYKDLSHLIIILDDFILNKNVNQHKLNLILTDPILQNVKYLRLKKIEESFVMRFISFFKKKTTIGKSKMFKIRKSHPYFYSLQIAIWDINYLIDSITNCNDIWQFENQKPGSADHWTLSSNIFNYQHVVEKGKWEYYAESYCKKHINFFEKGNRDLISNKIINKVTLKLKIIKFFIFGYIKIHKNEKINF